MENTTTGLTQQNQDLLKDARAALSQFNATMDSRVEITALSMAIAALIQAVEVIDQRTKDANHD